MSNYNIPELPLGYELETKAVLKQVNLAGRKLAELNGVARTIPNEDILISTLTLQEAKNSSEVENIVTTQDELYKAELGLQASKIKSAEKEVMNYRNALIFGYRQVKEQGFLSLNTIKGVQQRLENNDADIECYMKNLEQFINDESLCGFDPLVKMAVLHHQFESIHPFYDGNGRTGRIILILYLVLSDLLDLPILYLSRYITRNKVEYYRLIQSVRDNDGDNFRQWEEWIIFMLKGVEEASKQSICLVNGISKLMADYKSKLRPVFGRLYRHELLNNLFFHPYTKIEYVKRDMMVSRKTATEYLEKIVDMGLLKKKKVGRSNYYINSSLVDLFLNVGKW